MSLKELYSKDLVIDQAYKSADVTFCDRNLTNVLATVS